MKKLNFLIVLSALFFISCTSPEKNKKTEQKSTKDTCETYQKPTVIYITDSYTLLEGNKIPVFKDGLPKKSAIEAAKSSLQYCDSLKAWNADEKLIYRLGDRDISANDIYFTIKEFLNICEKHLSNEQLNKEVREKFDIYQFTIPNKNGNVFFTSYFEPPSYPASLEKSEEYQFPMYSTPTDLVFLKEEDFGDKLMKEKVICSKKERQLFPYTEGEKIIFYPKEFAKKWTGGKLTGRIINNKFSAYYNRTEIDLDKKLEKENLVKPIAWLKNPADLMDIHLQGSGWLILPDKTKKRVHFTFTNSLTFKSYVTYISRKHKISKGRVSVNEFLNKNHKTALADLACNPRYVFFEFAGDIRLGETRTPLIPYRSAAVDTRYLPLGALTYIQAKWYKDFFSEVSQKKVQKAKNQSLFMFCHDVGGAIKKNHIDYYVGNVLNETIYDKKGKVYLMILKK